jgi:hypothetical protein
MLIDLRRDIKLYHALYSDVFRVDDRVYKLFKDSPDPNLKARACRLFEAQCDAFERAAAHEFMSAYVPCFYGVSIIEDVIDSDACCIKERYMLDHCYAIEFLHGEEFKVTSDEVLHDFSDVFTVRERFESFGINTRDASVFLTDDPKVFKFIDIDTKAF